MKKKIFILFFLFVTFSVTAQGIVSTQGDSYSNANGSIDFTIGEVVINTAANGSNAITQGFHQTNWNFLGQVNHSPNYEATISPNPTEDIINISTSTFDNVTYTLYDVQGKLVLQNKLSAEITPIQVHQLAPGSYLLTLSNKEQSLKTFKLIKLN